MSGLRRYASASRYSGRRRRVGWDCRCRGRVSRVRSRRGRVFERWRSLSAASTIWLATPAHCRAVSPQPTGMPTADAYGSESARRRRRLTKRVITPAHCRAVCAQSTGMPTADAYGSESTRRRRRLSLMVPSPAYRCAVCAQSAGGIQPDAYRFQGFIPRYWHSPYPRSRIPKPAIYDAAPPAQRLAILPTQSADKFSSGVYG